MLGQIVSLLPSLRLEKNEKNREKGEKERERERAKPDLFTQWAFEDSSGRADA